MSTPQSEDKTYDLIVVGAGGAGLMAALTAAEQGLKVLVLEKGARIGGTTALSFGVFATSDTQHQARAGIVDDPQAHFEDLDNFAGALIGRDNLVLRRRLVENAPRAFRKLLELGSVFMEPISEPGHRVPRLHKALPHSRALTELVARRCRKLGVEFRTRADVAELIEADGRVTGVSLKNGEAISCRKAVLLTTGDMSNAPTEFKKNYLPADLVPIPGLNPLSTGDGQQLGVKLGGEVRNGDLVWGPEIRFVERPTPTFLSLLPVSPLLARIIKMMVERLPPDILRPLMMSFVTSSMRPSPVLFERGAIFVNRDGVRFADEGDRPEVNAARQPGGEVYVVFDHQLAQKLGEWPNYVSTAPVIDYAYLQDYERHRADLVHKHATLTGAAKATGLPAEALEQSVRSANASGTKNITTGPFYILGPARPCIFFGEGGLAVNDRLQILRANGAPVEGVYAAGSAGQGGLLLNGHGHHVAWAFTSGLIAAEFIAEPALV